MKKIQDEDDALNELWKSGRLSVSNWIAGHMLFQICH